MPSLTWNPRKTSPLVCQLQRDVAHLYQHQAEAVGPRLGLSQLETWNNTAKLALSATPGSYQKQEKERHDRQEIKWGSKSRQGRRGVTAGRQISHITKCPKLGEDTSTGIIRSPFMFCFGLIMPCNQDSEFLYCQNGSRSFWWCWEQ